MKNFSITRKCELIVTESRELPQASTTAMEYRCAGILVPPALVDQAVQERAVLGAVYYIAAMIDYPLGQDRVVVKFTSIKEDISSADQLDVAIPYKEPELMSELAQLLAWSSQTVTIALQAYTHTDGENLAILTTVRALYQSGMAPEAIRTSTSEEHVPVEKHQELYDQIKKDLPTKVKFSGCYDVEFMQKRDAIFSMSVAPFKSICDISDEATETKETTV